MKIQQKFLNLVRDGIKKHEYRLNDEKNQLRKIGDEILLISNEDSHNFIRVKILNIEYYKNWEDALRNTWQEDFKGIYNNINMVVEECNKFYSKSQLTKYGIAKFSIEIFHSKIKNALLDTNIIIQRESHNSTDFNIMQLYKWFESLSIRKIIHPITWEEINKYKDKLIVANIQNKLSSYDTLIPNTKMTRDFESIVNKYPMNDNSRNDNLILFQLFDGIVDLLITNDKQMKDKANDLEVSDKVLSVEQALKIFEDENPSLIKYKMLSVELKKFGEIDLNDSFFDTLKEDYPGFNNWFKKKNIQTAYVYVDNDKNIKGFLFLKDEDENEDYSDIEPRFDKKKRLKIGTFKTDYRGFHLGERFMKTIFDNAIRKKVDEIYVTLFTKRREAIALRDMFLSWGFVYHGKKKSNQELVYVKKLMTYDNSKDPKFNFPNYKKERDYYFLPIYPEYHTNLFPDAILKTEDMRLYQGNKGHLYALEKIYVSSTFSQEPKPGDTILIYRSGERQPRKFSSVVTGICILQEIINPKTIDEYLTKCSNRSVFSEKMLREFWDDKKYRKIIKLIYCKTFDKKIILEDLWNLGIVAPPDGPRPFEKITQEQYNKIIDLSKR